MVSIWQGPGVSQFRAGGIDGDGHLLWKCTFHPLVEIRENPEFHDLVRIDKGHWPGCLLWHGWLPLLSGTDGASLQAESAAQGAGILLECALGPYSSRLPFEWDVPPLPREGEGEGFLMCLMFPMLGRMVA